jgi:DNA-binding transcriptional MerR regulator
MAITADERRSILGLFNVSEAARRLGVPIRKMHWEITAGRLPKPRIRLGRRRYYHADDLRDLAERCAEMQNHP